jgi:hypothetical protein
VFQLAWSHTLAPGLRGLALAREREGLLAWDQNHWLYVLDHEGQRQGQIHFPGELVAACCADDGSAYAAVGGKGELCWLAPDLMVRWQQTLPQPALAVAMDPFGQYLAVADVKGGVHFFNCLGQAAGSLTLPRPLHHLVFVPAVPVAVGSADYGLVAAFDLKGNVLWRDGLVAHAGSLAVSGDGAQIVLACFSEGLRRYDQDGKNLGRLPGADACRLASLAFTGRFILLAGMTHRLTLLDRDGQSLAFQAADNGIVALALSALGDYAVAALANGTVVKWMLAPVS